MSVLLMVVVFWVEMALGGQPSAMAWRGELRPAQVRPQVRGPPRLGWLSPALVPHTRPAEGCRSLELLLEPDT